MNVLQFRGDLGQPIARITLDSRSVEAGDLFVAVRGTVSDGHQYISQAIQSGATIIVAEEKAPEDLARDISWMQVSDSREALGRMAENLYDAPSKELRIVGVTGTNGKTSVVYLLYQLFTALGFPCGLISTIQIRWPGFQEDARLTTPDVISLQKTFRQMVESGVTYVFMEVSSHAITQGRIDRLTFAGGVFTNLTHDHLDYHGTFAHYLAAKKTFFDQLSKEAFALINLDDKHGKVMVQNCPASIKTYSLRTMSDFKGRILENRLEGLSMKMNDRQIACRLVGDFNAYNLLAALGAACSLGIDEEEALQALSGCAGAKGRLEILRHPSGRMGVVDFAHTPDALEKVINTLQELKPKQSRLVSVVGCGGDRDRQKRPVMGQIAAAGSDLAVFTADNPRSEAIQVILDEMVSGVAARDDMKVQVIADRKQAIQIAARLARVGDVILVAGKGHETYQDIGGVRYPFDDMKVLNEALEIPVNS